MKEPLYYCMKHMDTKVTLLYESPTLTRNSFYCPKCDMNHNRVIKEESNGVFNCASSPFSVEEGIAITKYTHVCPTGHFESYEAGECKICKQEMVEIENPKEPTIKPLEPINNPFE